VKVLTEKTQYPSNVHLGILLDLGTRDENLETTGSLLSIKNTYMKTVLNTNETVLYLQFRSTMEWSKWQAANSTWTMTRRLLISEPIVFLTMLLIFSI
jgi:hypothetical protein